MAPVDDGWWGRRQGPRPKPGPKHQAAHRNPHGPRVEVGDYIVTRPAPTKIRCRGWTASASQGGGQRITTFPCGTRLGPVEAVERTIEFVSVRVGPVWINIWGAFGSSSGHPTKFAYVERSGLREEMDESEVIEDDEVTNERGTSSGMTVSGEGPGMEQ